MKQGGYFKAAVNHEYIMKVTYHARLMFDPAFTVILLIYIAVYCEFNSVQRIHV